MHERMTTADPSWDDLRLFLAVLRAGSFTEAARRLEVEQSTVSRRIARLERSLAAPLFDRTPAGLSATDLAERLADHAEGVERHALAFVDEAHGTERAPRGRVTLALTEAMALHIVVPRLLPQLRERYPELVVDLRCSDRNVDLLRREADVALRFVRPTRGELIAQRVARMPTAVLGTRALVRSIPRRRRKDPAAYPWVGFHLAGIDAPEERWHEEFVGVDPVVRTDSYVSQVAAVRAGLGVALLSTGLRELDPELRVVDFGLPFLPTLELWLVTHRAIRQLPRVAAVYELLAEALPALDGR